MPPRRQRNHIVGFVIGVGAGLTEAGDAGVDQARAHLGEIGVAQSSSRHHPRLLGLDEQIGIGGELAEQRLSLAAVEIEGDPPLAGIEVGKGEARLGAALSLDEGFFPTGRAAPRRLDQDHIGAEIGEKLAAVLPRRAGQIEDAKPLQGARRLMIGLRQRPSARAPPQK
jgi:hypothetical protein